SNKKAKAFKPPRKPSSPRRPKQILIQNVFSTLFPFVVLGDLGGKKVLAKALQVRNNEHNSERNLK
ncbi:MAG TPA: hypothetical protein VIJ93_14270, partial [bacterium]